MSPELLMWARARIAGGCVCVAACVFAATALAQVDPPGIPGRQVDDFVELKAAEGEGIDLAGLVKLLQGEEGMQIFFDPQTFPGESRIVFFGEARIRSGEQFFQFVQLILRNSGYAIVKSEVGGMHRIVPLANVRPFVPRRNAGDHADLTAGLQKYQYITGIFPLDYVSPDDAENHLKHFVLGSVQTNNNNPPSTSVEGIVLKLPPNILIVTELASRMNRIRDAIATIDVPQAQVDTRFIEVRYLEAKSLETQLKSILQQQDSVLGSTGSDDLKTGQTTSAMRELGNIQISSDERTNRLILIGTRAAIDRAMGLVDQLDRSLELDVQSFQFQHISAGRIDALIRKSLPDDARQLARFYQSTINESTNTLVVTARADIIKRIEDLKMQLDIPGSSFKESSPVMFYKLKHVQAADILDTLQRVSRQYRPDLFADNPRQGFQSGINTATGFRNRDGFAPTGPNRVDPNREGQFQEPRFVQDDANNRQPGGFAGQAFPGTGSLDPFGSPIAGLLDDALFGAENILPGEAQITIDENTNTLIVVAEPEIQELYAELIAKLDVYRPQVLVEVTVVTLDAQEDFNLGVEISGGDRRGDQRLFSFTSFGLSEVAPATGALAITPGLGFNGTLVDPDVADVVLRALSRHRRARVVSAPRILVSDNATGLLSSVAEVPFSSINASNTVATTSFAGFATAGTTVSVTPHISEGDYLNLEFDVLVNDFTGAGNDTLPPPRNTDQVTSEVSIPDGYTVIVGGLTRQRSSVDQQGVPFLEDVPLFRFFTSNSSDGEREQRLFVFIKPIILKDDKFMDLRYFSDIDHRKACIPGDFPKSEPLLTR